MKSLRPLSLLFLFVFTFSSVLRSSANEKIALPDFAYPQDALKTAELLMKSKAGDERVLGVLEYSQAQKLIDNASQPATMKFIEQLAAKETDPAVKSLLLLLAAKTGHNFKWNSSLCKSFAPEAETLEQAKAYLYKAVDSLSTLATQIAPETPLKDFYNVFDWSDIGLSILPTVRDFVAYTVSSISNDESVTVKAVKQGSPAYYAIKAKSYQYLEVDTIEALLGNRDADYAIYSFLQKMRPNRENTSSFKSFYNLLDEAKMKCKGSWVEETVDSVLSFYNQPYFTVNLSVISPRERKIRLDLYNLKESTITLYRYLTKENAHLAFVKEDFSKGEKIFEKTYEGEETPFGVTYYSDTIRLQPGHYVISYSNEIKNNRLYGQVFTISPFIEFELTPGLNKRSKIQLLDNSTGEPMSDVTILTGGDLNKWNRTDIRLDKNGCFELPWSPSGYDIKYIDKKSGVEIISDTRYYPRQGSSSPKQDISYSVSPDLPVYRPGDKVRLTLVATKENQTVNGNKVDVKIILPEVSNGKGNSSDKRTLNVAFGNTDEFGRATAELTIPEDCPLGIAFIRNKKNNQYLGSIEIAEFKLNDLKISPLTYRYTTDSIFVTGSTINTAGIAVGNIVISGDVSFDVEDHDLPEIEIDTVSNDRGVFEFSFPRYWSANTKIDNEDDDDEDEDDEEEFDEDDYFTDDYRYFATIYIDAESPNGRNASSRDNLNMEYPNHISLYIDNFLNKKKGTNVLVGVGGSNPPEEYIWKIVAPKGKKTVASGTAKGILNLNPSVLKPLEPGKYILVVELPDRTAQPCRSKFAIYDTSSSFVPTEDQFIIPDTQLSNRENNMEIGVKEDTYVWLYYGYFAKGSQAPYQKIEGHKLKKGWHKLPIDVGFWPETYNSGSIKVYSIQNSVNISVQPVKAPELTLTCESFRDNVDAGSQQTWQLVTRLDDKPVPAAVYLNVVNSKILTLGQIETPTIYHTYKSYDYWATSIGRRNQWLPFNGVLKPLDLKPQVMLPIWRDLGATGGGIKIRGIGSLNYAANSDSGVSLTKEAVLKEVPEEDEALNDLVVVGYGTQSRKIAGLKVESAVMRANYTTTVSADLYGARAPIGNPEDFLASEMELTILREPKVYTALWEPMLTTDLNGTVDVSFLVPGETTEWSLAARAWTKDLFTAFLSKRFSATRQLIVAPNPPRFVRVGDRVNLVTAVTNNSDTTMTVRTSIVVNADSVALVDNSETLTIEAHATNYLTTPLNVDVTGGDLEYTVRVTDGVTGDGERNIIPVFESSALVTESRNFYINPGEGEYSTALPEREGSDFATELHYTTNPMWTVVESLPKAIKPWCQAATAVAMSIYTSRTALELSEKFTDAKDVIDVKNAKKYSDEGLKALKKMQGANGGFKWAEWASETDRYSTLGVLDWLSSEANDPDISKLIKPALDYVDLTSVGKDGKVYPDFTYTVIRSFYGRPNDQNGSRVVNKTIKEIMDKWKTFSLDKKALAAIALKNYGYDKAAKAILESLEQFGRQTTDRGFEFPNMPNILAYTHTLEAFASIQPKSDIVNGIVQHLLYIRQGMDWGSTSLTTYAVRSIMDAASSWVVKPTPASVTVDGRPVETSSEGAVGALNAPVEGRQLTISRPDSDYPAYGAIVSTFVKPLSDIAPFSDGEIEISKTVVRVGSDGKETPIGTNAEVNPGEKLSVVLLVTSKRPLTNIVVTDMRPAAFEPVVQVPRMIWNRSTPFYLENRDELTNIYVDYIPAGTSQFVYEVTVNNTGTFTTGQATVRSAIAPELTAHSGSAPFILKNRAQ